MQLDKIVHFYTDIYEAGKNNTFASSELNSIDLLIPVSSMIVGNFTMLLVLNANLRFLKKEPAVDAIIEHPKISELTDC